MTIRLAANPADAPPERSLTVRDVAQRLSISECWVRRAVRDGLLEGHHVGRAVRIYESSVREYQARNPTAVRPKIDKPRKPPIRTPQHREAMANLARKGLVF